MSILLSASVEQIFSLEEQIYKELSVIKVKKNEMMFH